MLLLSVKVKYTSSDFSNYVATEEDVGGRYHDRVKSTVT